MSEKQRKIPITGPDPCGVTTHPCNRVKVRSREPYSTKKVGC
jgi:hypothetical protein